MGFVSAHVRPHRGGLAVSYGVAVIENTFELLYPFAIGLAVDGLLDGSWGGVTVFVVLSLAHTCLGVARQWFDTRLFNRMYAEFATDLVENQRAEGVATTSMVARTFLADEYVDFLRSGVNTAITAAFAVLGSLVMLFFYDPLLGVVAAAVALPVVVINRRLMRRSAGIYRALNDQSEREVSLIDQGSVKDVRRHFGVIGGHWNRLSDAEGISWGVVDVLALGLAVFALVRATGTSEEVGAIFATIAYVWAYIGGFDQVPAVLQRMSNLADIRRRLDGLGDAQPPGTPSPTP
ncbi:MAG TPA: ABC transporter six-transmembrane domain-containing protein [Candidatus Limnocylindrales bacterium]|nr:ABC transporter six-transmembrane domain-containing protein [Candidatus Limnocylindrales bacterium]